MSAFALRAAEALRRRHNWIQLGKFGAVGLSGYAINLGVYSLVLGWGVHTAAAVSFVVSAANNYWWNRHWTFANQKGHFGYQGLRYLVVTLVARVPRLRTRRSAVNRRTPPSFRLTSIILGATNRPVPMINSAPLAL